MHFRDPCRADLRSLPSLPTFPAATSGACYDAVLQASFDQCLSLFNGGTCSDACDAALASAATLQCGSKNAFDDAITGAENLSEEVSNQSDMLALCPTDFNSLFGSSAALQQRPGNSLAAAALATVVAAMVVARLAS